MREPRGVSKLTTEHRYPVQRKGFFAPIFSFFPTSFGMLRTFFAGGGTIESSAPVNAARSYGGITVTPEIALSLSAVWACVWRYANTISTLPLFTMQTGVQNTATVAGKHPLYSILHDQPNANMSAAKFWQATVASMLTWGFAIAGKDYVGSRLVGLTPWRPEWTTTYLVNGLLRYRYQRPGDPKGPIDVSAEEVFVVIDRTMDGYTAVSRIQYGANSLAAAAAADRAAALQWKNGMRASGILTIAQWLKPEQRAAYRDLVNEFTGTGTGEAEDKQFGVLVAENATKFEPISLKPQDLELLDSRRFSVEDVCRWYDMPPILIGHSAEGQTMWGSGIEQIILGWLKLGLAPVLRAIEQELWRQVLSSEDRASGIFAEFNLDALLRGDSTARANFYSTMTQNGVYTRNEARARENLPPVDGGDMATVQSALMPLDQLGKTPEPAPVIAPAPMDEEATNGTQA